MPVVRQFSTVSIGVGQGGRLMPDRPLAEVGPANYTRKENFRREGVGSNAEEVKREGWDWFFPNSGGSATNQKTIFASAVTAIGEARRPNGKTSVVACCANGKVYAFSYDTSAWVEIGTGYSNPPSGHRWEIVPVGSYVVFNNGIDLPFTWLVGDAAVSPIYELRERGVASVGTIWEANQILCCANILEILPASLAGIMNGVSPYGQITNPATTQRWQFRKIWSNNGDPRDFAATAVGSINAASSTLTLTYPMASFVDGTEIVILGAATDGGNLTATISSGGGTASITISTPAVTTVSGTDVLRSTAQNSIVGSYDFDNDGALVLRGKRLQNRSVVYKSSSIFVGYYTGDVDEPWVYEHVYTGKRTPRYRWTLIDVGGGYHLYAGDEHFYRFRLGTQEPEIDEVLADCEDSLFFTLVGDTAASGGVTEENEVLSADNATTNEIFFLFRYGATKRILAYDYLNMCASSVVLGSETFSCMATIHRPLAATTGSERELWFVFGDTSGFATTYGRSNLVVNTLLRYGASFTALWRTGLIDFGDPLNEKDVRSWTPISSSTLDTVETAFRLYGADRVNQTLTQLEVKGFIDDSTPCMIPLYYRRMYFCEQVENSGGAALRMAGRVWEVSRIRDRGLTRGVAAA